MTARIIDQAVGDGCSIIGYPIPHRSAIAHQINESLVAVRLAAQVNNVDVVGIGVRIAGGVAGRDHH